MIIDKTECFKYQFNPEKKVRYDLYWGINHKGKYFTSIHSDEEMIKKILESKPPHNRVALVTIYKNMDGQPKRIYSEKRDVVVFTPNPKKEKVARKRKPKEKVYIAITPMPEIDFERCKTDFHYCRRLVLRLFNFYE